MISVITPTLNAEKFISKSVESFLRQDIREEYEVIVVDSSSDKTPDILAKYPMKVIRQAKLGPAAARNLGVRKSKGNIVVFVDADCLATKSWLRKIVEPFSGKDVAAVAGAYKVWNKDNLIARFLQYEIEQRYEGMRKMDNIDFVGSYNCAYRKNIFTRFGGFNEKMVQGEDAELSFRVAEEHKIVFQPSAYVYHRHASNLKDFAKQKFQRGRWKVFLYKQHGRKVVKNVYTPAGLMLQTLMFAISLLLFGLSFTFHALFYFSALFMLLSYALNANLLAFICKKEPELLPASLVFIFVRNLFASFGLIFGTLSLLKCCKIKTI